MTDSADKLIIGTSRAMTQLRERIHYAARTPLPVFIEGPTGAGKELVAAALHAISGRPGKLVAFNVCAIAEQMFEDALFGHVRGSFTGAVADNAGFLREAENGTIFLDEISGLPEAQQMKLLRAIELGVFRPVGGHRDVHSNARVIAASNEPISALVEAGRFRSDLAHRLAGVMIRVPSLDDRREDIPLLVQYFLTKSGHPALRATDGVLRVLQARHWPGNVRELKNLVEWVAVLCEGRFDEGALEAALVQRFVGLVGQDDDAVHKNTLREALDRHDWRIGRTARALAMHRTTLYRHMKRLRLSARAGDAPDDANDADGCATIVHHLQPSVNSRQANSK